MRKNQASQTVAFQAVSTTDGSAVTTGTPTVYYLIDGGTQGTGSGTSTHEGNGCWSYVPAQAETNGNHVAFTFTLSGAVSQTVNVYPVSFDPTDSVRMGMTALPNAAADAAGGLPISDAGGLDLDTMNSNVSAILTDTGTTIPATLTDMSGATFNTATDSLEAIRNRGDLSWITATTVDLNADQSGVTVGAVSGNVGGNVTGSVGSISGVTFPTNFSALVISAGGAVDSLVQGFLNNTIAETTADNISANFETFFDNGNALTSKIVNDVGVAGSGLTAQQVWEYNISAIATAGYAGTVLNARASQTSVDTIDGIVDAILLDTGTDGVVIAAGQSVASVTGAVGSVTGNVGGSVASVTGAVGSVTGNVGGNVVGSVASVTGTVGGISGTITTLDALDTAQDTQHSNTQSAITSLNNLSAAQVNAEVDAALADIHLDHLLAVDYDPASKPGVATALLNELVESDAGVSRFTTNALENAPSGTGGDATAANQATIIAALTTVDTVVDGIQTDLDNGTDGLGAIKTAVDAISVSASPVLIQTTTIATLTSQTVFTLTAGSSDDDAYNGLTIIVTDAVTSTQKAVGTINDYVGATKTVTLRVDPAIFTMAAGDTVSILAAVNGAVTGSATGVGWLG